MWFFSFAYFEHIFFILTCPKMDESEVGEISMLFILSQISRETLEIWSFKTRTSPRDIGLSPQIIIWENEYLNSLISPSAYSGTDLTAKTRSFQCRRSRRRKGCSFRPCRGPCEKEGKIERGSKQMCLSVFTPLGYRPDVLGSWGNSFWRYRGGALALWAWGRSCVELT